MGKTDFFNEKTTWGVILILCFFTLDCQRPDKEEIEAEAGPNQLVHAADLTPQGWDQYGEARFFTPENLYKHINGRAEFFLAYDFVKLTFISFEKKNDIGSFVNLSVYDMGTPTNAFGVFSGERSKAAPPLDLGRDAYRSNANYYIWKGRYYVQIITSADTDELRRIGMDMARKVTDSLTDSGEPVWGLNTLPEADRVPGSVQYFRVDAMGLDFMRNTYTAEYAKDGTLVKAFLSQQDSPDSARMVVARYIEYAERYGEGVEFLNRGGVELALCDMGRNYDVISQEGRLVAGVSMVEDQNLAVQVTIDLWRQLSSRIEDRPAESGSSASTPPEPSPILGRESRSNRALSHRVRVRINPTINAKTSATINAKTSTGINAKTSATINARTSTGINAKTSAGINARTSTGINARTSTKMNAKTSVYAHFFSPKIGGDTEGVETLTTHTLLTSCRPAKIKQESNK